MILSIFILKIGDFVVRKKFVYLHNNVSVVEILDDLALHEIFFVGHLIQCMYTTKTQIDQFSEKNKDISG